MQSSHSADHCSSVLQTILSKAFEQIHERQLINHSHAPYCSLKTLNFSNQIYSQYYFQQQKQNAQPQQQEPSPLQWDNMFPVDVDLNTNEDLQQIKNKYKKNCPVEAAPSTKGPKSIRNLSHISSSPSVTTVKKTKQARQLEKYQKLDISERSEEENIYGELRKQVEQDEVERKAKQLQKKKRMKERQRQGKGYDAKVGFSYDGAVVKLSVENRKRLVDNGIDGDLLNSIEKTKQIKGPVQPTKIQYPRNTIKKMMLSKNQIQFTDIRTLFSDAKASKGVKLSEGGISVQDKKRVLPVKQLKKMLGNYKLSKEQYKRIKESMGEIAQYEELGKSLKSSDVQNSSEKTGKQLEQQKSASESKISNEPLTRRRSTITISDPQLLDNMLYGPINQAQERVRVKQDTSQQEIGGHLDTIDNYNIEYMRSGGNMNIKKKSKSVADLLTLPKIRDHTKASQFGSTKQMPRGRQKLKEGVGMVREIRKRFEQKLRL